MRLFLVMSNIKLVPFRRLFNGAFWYCPVSKMTYHTDYTETIHSSVDTTSPDYKVTWFGEPVNGGPKFSCHA